MNKVLFTVTIHTWFILVYIKSVLADRGMIIVHYTCITLTEHRTAAGMHSITGFGRIQKAGNVRIPSHWDAFVQPLLQWQSIKYYTFWVCVCVCVCVALGVQNAWAILSSVACPTPNYSSALSHKWHEFRKKREHIEHKMRLLISSTIYFRNFGRSRKNWTRCDQKIYISLQKYQSLLSDLNETWIFWIYFRIILKIPSALKILPIGTELFHAEGRTEVQTDRQIWHANSRFS
jgi:hypothetical protein